MLATFIYSSFDSGTSFVLSKSQIYLFWKEFGYDDDFNENITLEMLDMKRRQLKNPYKLTIYLPEEQYLHVKNHSSKGNHGLVEIKSNESYPFSKHPLRQCFSKILALAQSYSYHWKSNSIVDTSRTLFRNRFAHQFNFTIFNFDRFREINCLKLWNIFTVCRWVEHNEFFTVRK